MFNQIVKVSSTLYSETNLKELVDLKGFIANEYNLNKYKLGR